MSTIWDFWAAHYEGLWAQRFSLAPTRSLIREHVKSVTVPKTILELGCGVGQLAQELAFDWPQAEILAVDPAKQMIDRAIRDYSATNITYQIGNLFDVKKDGFDLITCTHAFPYEPDKLKAVETMASLLKPGGRLLLANANTENLYDKLWLVFVALTTTKANYPSTTVIREFFLKASLKPGVVKAVKKPAYIPSIYMVEAIK